MKKEVFALSKPLNHLALIMDGNGRWAKERHRPRTYGHKVALNNLIDIIEECARLGIKGMSIFAFSTENWKRPKDEIDKLFEYLNIFFKKELSRLIKDNIRIFISGDYHALPKKNIEVIDDAIAKTRKLTGLKLNICLNYGGQQEIVYAVNKLIKKKVKVIDKDMIMENIYAPELGPIDLLIRTSGEVRISNFMLFSLAYSEMIFTKTYFPDFDAEELHKCLEQYEGRNRRYGGLKNA